MTEQELQDKAKDLAKNVPLRTDTPYPEMIRYFFASMYLRGYDDGKNDTTEWHYPSKGELPDKDGEYLCRYYKYDIRFSKVLLYRVKDNKWYNLVYDEERRAPKPDAWQYFVPPKEER